MPATAYWGEDNGAQTGSPLHGTTQTCPTTGPDTVTQMNWKSVDDLATAPENASIGNGEYSYQKYQYLRLTGTFNSVNNGRWSHTATGGDTTLTGITISGSPDCVGTSDQLGYTTPVRTADGRLTKAMTGVTAIGSGTKICFSTGSPGAAKATAWGTAVAHSSSDLFSNYLVSQAYVSGAATGNSNVLTFTAEWEEN